MDVALCTIDGESYDIANFSKLEPALLNTLRHALICTKCHGKGYYRKESRDGKPACFGAYHEDDCKYKLKGSAPKLDPETVEEVNTIITNSDTINVNFTAYTVKQLTPPTSSTLSTTRAPSATFQQHTRQPAQLRNATKGLRSLLRMLMHSDSFATSDIAINTGWKHPRKAKNLFVNFDDVSEELITNKKMRGYWGIISHADDEINWLNTANKQDVSIPVSKLRDYLIDVFKINNAEDLSGTAVLIFGWLDISKSDKKKWYLSVHNNNPAYIFIKLKK